MFKNLFYTEYTFVFASVLLVWDAKIVCVDWVCHTEILRVGCDQGVPIGPQAGQGRVKKRQKHKYIQYKINS